MQKIAELEKSLSESKLLNEEFEDKFMMVKEAVSEKKLKHQAEIAAFNNDLESWQHKYSRLEQKV